MTNTTINTIQWTEQFDNDLRQHRCQVQFYKNNGELRTMNATLCFEFIPNEYHPTGERQYDHTSVIRVFEYDKNQWRTINKDNVVQFTVLE